MLGVYPRSLVAQAGGVGGGGAQSDWLCGGDGGGGGKPSQTGSVVWANAVRWALPLKQTQSD